MYKKRDGTWKSDFRMFGERYQHSWDTTIESKAMKLEEDFKARIRQAKDTYQDVSKVSLDWLLGFSETAIQERENTMTLSELRDYMYEKVWCRFADSVNPVNRMNKIIEFFGDVDVKTITADRIAEFKAHLISLGRAEKTVNHYLSTLNTSINLIVSTGTINIAKPDIGSLRMEEAPVKRDITYSYGDEKMILKYLWEEYEVSKLQTDLEYYHFILLMFKLGYRPSEFFALTIGDIDLKNKLVTISKGSNKGKTKNGLVRSLPLEGTSLNSFKELIRLAIVSRYQNPDIEGSDEMLKEILKELEGTEGDFDVAYLPSYLRKLPITRLSKYQCLDRWKKIKLKMGWFGAEEYKDYVQYAIRHTVATRLASELSFSAHQLMKFMGHKNMTTSLQYIHFNVTDLRDATKLGEGR